MKSNQTLYLWERQALDRPATPSLPPRCSSPFLSRRGWFPTHVWAFKPAQKCHCNVPHYSRQLESCPPDSTYVHFSLKSQLLKEGSHRSQVLHSCQSCPGEGCIIPISQRQTCIVAVSFTAPVLVVQWQYVYLLLHADVEAAPKARRRNNLDFMIGGFDYNKTFKNLLIC